MRSRSARAHGLPQGHDTDLSVLARATVRAAWDGGGVYVHRPSGILLRPVAGEHAQHRHRAVLDGDLSRELHEHVARVGDTQVQCSARWVELAAG